MESVKHTDLIAKCISRHRDVIKLSKHIDIDISTHYIRIITRDFLWTRHKIKFYKSQNGLMSFFEIVKSLKHLWCYKHLSKCFYERNFAIAKSFEKFTFTINYYNFTRLHCIPVSKFTFFFLSKKK